MIQVKLKRDQRELEKIVSNCVYENGGSHTFKIKASLMRKIRYSQKGLFNETSYAEDKIKKWGVKDYSRGSDVK